MPEIRPVSDLQTNLPDISRYVHESGEPLYLTQNGYGDMVIMSMAAFDCMEAERRQKGSTKDPSDQ